MINYTEKGAGLHEAIARAGYALRQENGAWVSNDDAAVQAIIDGYTLADAKDHMAALASAKAAALRDKALRGVSAGEMMAWAVKRQEAKAYVADATASTTSPTLKDEAEKRGIALSALVAKVLQKSARTDALEASIAAADGKHSDAIKACKSFAEVLAYDYSTGWPVV